MNFIIILTDCFASVSLYHLYLLLQVHKLPFKSSLLFHLAGCKSEYNTNPITTTWVFHPIFRVPCNRRHCPWIWFCPKYFGLNWQLNSFVSFTEKRMLQNWIVLSRWILIRHVSIFVKKKARNQTVWVNVIHVLLEVYSSKKLAIILSHNFVRRFQPVSRCLIVLSVDLCTPCVFTVVMHKM